VSRLRESVIVERHSESLVVWRLPNTSTVNRAFTVDMLTDAYKELHSKPWHSRRT
jgi:hypothetical protein